jgi:hypothetical protein
MPKLKQHWSDEKSFVDAAARNLLPPKIMENGRFFVIAIALKARHLSQKKRNVQDVEISFWLQGQHIARMD